MLHFDGHYTVSIKKVTFALKSGEYFEKGDIYMYGVNFDSGTYISMDYLKEYMTPTKFYTSILQMSIFV